jgi:hypothetical protein
MDGNDDDKGEDDNANNGHATTAATTAINNINTNNNVNDENENDIVKQQQQHDAVLQSCCIIPPSHILSNGRYIHLPPPTSNEQSIYFERAVASYGLINIDDNNNSEKKKVGQSKKRRRGADGDDDEEDDDNSNGAAAKSSTAPFIHPLAIASARLRAQGIDELSKAINLGGLVMSGEYFGLSNIVATANNDRAAAAIKKDNNVDGDDDTTKKKTIDSSNAMSTSKKVVESSTNSSSSNNNGSRLLLDENTTIVDQRLRSSYILDRRRLQYTAASTSLSRHAHRLISSIATTRIVDDRLRSLRHRWTMAVPEHGTSVNAGPVRPNETVTVDVEVYNRRHSGLVGANATTTAMGRIARRVPRYATLELNDEYDIGPDIMSLRTRIRSVIDNLQQKRSKGTLSLDDMEVDDIIINDQQKQFPTSCSLGNNATLAASCKTKAEPYAIANSTLGKMDPNNLLNDSNSNVPLLTLLFEIEKPSTGFVERATLSSNSSSSVLLLDHHHHTQPDECVIESLQHSLFCASFFECIRAEIIIPTTSSTTLQQSHSQQQYQQQKQHKSYAWLSSEMEESYLPPPSLMAGGMDNTTNKSSQQQRLCVIHCHEGELKVQLDAEYSLIVKLIEAGTTSVAAIGTINDTVDSSNKANDTTTTVAMQQPDDCTSNNNNYNDGMKKSIISGSQSPKQLRTLCRTLLLHSQSLYHDHCMRANKEGRSIDLSTPKNEVPADALFARKKSSDTKYYSSTIPNILQSCVTLGNKIVLEKKVRLVLKRLSQWLVCDMECSTTIDIEWLSLDVFCPISRFVLSFCHLCLDVEIHGHVLRVTSMTEDGYRSVGFSTDLELEYYLKLELRKATNNFHN